MKIRTTIDLIGNAYHVMFEITALSPIEQELIKQFGEPVVAIGGTIAGSATIPGQGSPTAVSFTIPAEDRTIPTEFPFKKIFSLDDTPNAGVQASVYRSTIETRIAAARTALIAKSPHFVGETVTTL